MGQQGPRGVIISLDHVAAPYLSFQDALYAPAGGGGGGSTVKELRTVLPTSSKLSASPSWTRCPQT